jgi:predicted lipid-binding transport protein (Tim44 family)
MKIRLFLLLTALTYALPALARVGGGESYSGGGGSDSGGGGGGDGDGEALFYLIRFLFWLTVEHPLIGIPVDLLVIWFFVAKSKGKKQAVLNLSSTKVESARPSPSLRPLVKFDPNFSEVVFADFCHSLFARVHRARGEKKLGTYAPYLSESVRAKLEGASRAIGEVKGIVVGSFSVTGFRGIETPAVRADVQFEANYTEVVGGQERRWYVRELWTLERQRDILSPPPEKSRADHCPKCGAALQTRTDGSCAYCGTRITNGAFQWYVVGILTREKSERPPDLAMSAPERGTNLPTVRQRNLEQVQAAFQSEHPEFVWSEFEQRVRMIATELQAAWTSRDWERARPFETDAIFQTHRYWIDEYRRQRMRNVVDDYRIGRIEAVKVISDAFYDAITVRIWGSGFDHTDDESGNVVAGSKTDRREWTEYWTLIRSRRQTNRTTTTANCPNCGAELKVSETGICAFCQGRITSGDFDWVLSRIEQDESYGG